MSNADLVRYERVDRVAVITIDNPPVNALSPAVWQGLDDAVRRAAGDPAVDAVVLTGAGSTFIAGADIKVFATLKTREQSLERSAGTHALLKRLEDCPKPVVAAIHGVALGGGNEVAMSCHYRIAARNASVGQPEVLLGIIPGAGGTQRLPRLCGTAMALEMCTDGKPVSAARALEAGIVDRVVDGDLRPAAIAFAREHIKGQAPPRTRARADRIADVDRAAAECARMRASLTRTA
jgi:3-hydroxyacyl-CoA dehydrogenase